MNAEQSEWEQAEDDLLESPPQEVDSNIDDASSAAAQRAYPGHRGEQQDLTAIRLFAEQIAQALRAPVVQDFTQAAEDAVALYGQVAAALLLPPPRNSGSKGNGT